MPGAYADGVLFLPQELEGTIDYREPTPTEHPRPCVIEAQAAHAASLAKNDSTSNSRPLVAGFIMLVVALSLIIYKKRRMRGSIFSSSWTNSSQKEIGFGTRYVELQNLEDSPDLKSSPASMQEVVNLIL